jgi:hypothetical protein
MYLIVVFKCLCRAKTSIVNSFFLHNYTLPNLAQADNLYLIFGLS